MAMFEVDLDGLVERFLTYDECWVHHFKSETKQQSMQWKCKGFKPGFYVNSVFDQVVLYHLIFSALSVDFFVCTV